MRAELVSTDSRPLTERARATRSARSPQQPHLLRLDHIHEAGAEACDCGGKLAAGVPETKELLEVDAKHGWHLARHHIHSLCCRSCGQTRRPSADALISYGSVSLGVIAHVLFARYEHHQTLYQQAAAMSVRGISIKRAALTSWIIHGTNLLMPLAEQIRHYALQAPLINAANAPVEQVQHTNARLWVYLARAGAAQDVMHPAVWFRFTLQRSGTHAIHELVDYQGAVQAASHAGYDRLWAGGRVGRVGCWSSFQDRLTETQRHLPQTLSSELLETVRSLLACEKSRIDIDPPARDEARRQRAANFLDIIKRLLQEAKQQPGRNAAHEIATEMLACWDGYSCFLDNPAIDIDNGVAAGLLDRLTNARRNWVFGGSRDAGKRAAAVYTVIETCRLNGIDGFSYLRWVLPKLAALQDQPPAASLMPWHFHD